MNTIERDTHPDELTEAECYRYYSLILNPDKRKRTRAFIRQGGNRRQDHGTRGNTMRKGVNRFVDYKDLRRQYDEDAQVIIRRRVFRAAGRQITGTM